MTSATLRRRISLAGALVLLAAPAASALAQDVPEAQLTTTQRILSHVDFGLSVAGSINKTTSGPITTNNTTVSDRPSNTVGAFAQLRYTRSPLVGFELNFLYSRSAQNFTGANVNENDVQTPYQEAVQSTNMQTTLGYVVHTPQVFGLQTFVSGGGGTTDFRPTKGGGQGLASGQARATYYYSAGVEDMFGKTFGARAAFRQSFYLAPDFQATYFRDHQHTSSIEPTIGFFARF